MLCVCTVGWSGATHGRGKVKRALERKGGAVYDFINNIQTKTQKQETKKVQKKGYLFVLVDSICCGFSSFGGLAGNCINLSFVLQEELFNDLVVQDLAAVRWHGKHAPHEERHPERLVKRDPKDNVAREELEVLQCCKDHPVGQPLCVILLLTRFNCFE